MRTFWLLGLVMAGCSGDDTGTDTDAVDTDAADTDVEAACVVLTDGTYAASGSCFGMAMTVDLAFDPTDCAFALENWSMNHGDAPDGGTLAGSDVTLTGTGAFASGCTGTVDAGAMSGTCTDGCAWTLDPQ